MENRTKIETLISHSIEMLKKYESHFGSNAVIRSSLTEQILHDLVEAKNLLEDEPNIANIILYEYDGQYSQDPEDFIEDLVENKEIPTFEEFVNDNFSASDILIKLRREKQELSSVEADILQKYQEACKKTIADYYFDTIEVTINLDAI